MDEKAKNRLKGLANSVFENGEVDVSFFDIALSTAAQMIKNYMAAGYRETLINKLKNKVLRKFSPDKVKDDAHYAFNMQKNSRNLKYEYSVGLGIVETISRIVFIFVTTNLNSDPLGMSQNKES